MDKAWSSHHQTAARPVRERQKISDRESVYVCLCLRERERNTIGSVCIIM